MPTRTMNLNLKILPEHKKALRALAWREGEAMSVVLRRLIKKAGKENGVWPIIEELETFTGESDENHNLSN